MASGFVSFSISKNGDISYYAREEECTYVLSSAHMPLSKDALLEKWQSIEQIEKLGDKTLGIRGRYDAQVRTNIIVSLPNEVSPKDAAERIQKLIHKTPIKSCSYSIFIHKGQKDGITNQHAHVVVNERNINTLKKERDLNSKFFIQKTFLPTYQAEFAPELAKAQSYEKRDRIATYLYQSDPSLARETLRGVSRGVFQGTLAENESLVRIGREELPNQQQEKEFLSQIDKAREGLLSFAEFEKKRQEEKRIQNFEERKSKFVRDLKQVLESADKKAFENRMKEHGFAYDGVHTVLRDGLNYRLKQEMLDQLLERFKAAEIKQDPYYPKWLAHQREIERQNLSAQEGNLRNRTYWQQQQATWDERDKNHRSRVAQERKRLEPIAEKKNFFGSPSHEAKDAQTKIAIIDKRFDSHLLRGTEYETFYLQFGKVGEYGQYEQRPTMPRDSFDENRKALGFEEFKTAEQEKERVQKAEKSQEKEQGRSRGMSM